MTARTAFAPGERITTQVDYIYPNLDPITRTIPVRAVIENKDGKLKPGMFMTVSIDAAARPPALVIPSTALIRTGSAERVIVAYGDGRFRPAAVESGAEADGMMEIRRRAFGGRTRRRLGTVPDRFGKQFCRRHFAIVCGIQQGPKYLRWP